jgi:tripartite-type tricarboxylate transporter receptor subunit TctC
MKSLSSKCTAVWTAALIMAFMPACVSPMYAQEKYPARAIHLIVPFNAGGASDIVARVIGNSISEKLGQPVIVENRPGATGMIGSLAVSRAEPDGYTLLMAVISSHAVSPAMKKVPPFDPVKDFTPIVRVANSVHTLIARTTLPVTDLKSLIAYIKNNPGKVTYGSSGLASFPYLGGKLMEREAGLEMIHVPFSGDGPAVTALISQNVDILFTPSARAYVDAKTVKLIGDASLNRVASRPDWPTLNENGLPGFTLVSWVGLMGPPNMPRPIVDLINKTVNDALKEPAVENRLTRIGYDIAGGTPEEFVAAIRDEVVRIKALNIHLD